MFDSPFGLTKGVISNPSTVRNYERKVQLLSLRGSLAVLSTGENIDQERWMTDHREQAN